MTKVIELIVSPAGETTLQTKGFIGPECQNASGFLETALGQRLGERLTPEFHGQTATDLAQNQQQANQ
jgi:hypothetical protein